MGEAEIRGQPTAKARPQHSWHPRGHRR